MDRQVGCELNLAERQKGPKDPAHKPKLRETLGVTRSSMLELRPYRSQPSNPVVDNWPFCSGQTCGSTAKVRRVHPTLKRAQALRPQHEAELPPWPTLAGLSWEWCYHEFGEHPFPVE